MKLSSQKQISAKVLKIGTGKVWFDKSDEEILCINNNQSLSINWISITIRDGVHVSIRKDIWFVWMSIESFLTDYKLK